MITYLKLGRHGRLGNQMFEIAGTIGTAINNGHDFGFPEWKNHDHKTRFKSTEDIDIQKYFKTPLPPINPNCDYPEQYVPWGFHEFLAPDNISLWGHFQSEKYFQHCRPTIQKYFELKRPAALKGIEVQKNTIAIHVRLGDYDNNYHPRLNMEYYEPALAEFPANFPVLVFSDDIPATRHYFGNSVDYAEGNHYMTDLYLMTKCSNFIIGNSSFSWWPAWLSNNPGKKVIAPRRWFGPVCKADPKDIYAKGWIII